MAPALLLPRIPNGVPVSGDVMSVVVALISTTILSGFLGDLTHTLEALLQVTDRRLAQRFLAIKVWRRLPFVVWLVFAIYLDSYCFVFATALLQQSFGVNSSEGMCSGAILLCLVCYVTTKLIYVFLTEKAYIIRSTTKKRLRSKLYIFNSFGMLVIYTVVVIFNFVFRITRIENGQCIIGMRSIAMIPLISFDFVVNVYLTILFLIPLKNLYSFRNIARSPANIRLRHVAFRTFVGAVCTLISSIVNLSVLMALDGEPGWVCLMCCNCDILFSAIVIQWVTSKDNAGSANSPISSANAGEPNPRPRPNSFPDRPFSAAPGISPHSPAGTDAEMALVPTRRSSSDRSDDLPKIPSPASVVVTTTIRRQSNPCNIPFDDIKLEEEGYAGYGFPSRQARDSFARAEEMRASRTRISSNPPVESEPEP
ncbi:Fc.00g017940.m01.CDS01 [Cosmosporella sp. VM-42]